MVSYTKTFLASFFDDLRFRSLRAGVGVDGGDDRRHFDLHKQHNGAVKVFAIKLAHRQSVANVCRKRSAKSVAKNRPFNCLRWQQSVMDRAGDVVVLVRPRNAAGLERSFSSRWIFPAEDCNLDI